MNDNPIRHLLEKQDWGDLYARLLDFATHRCKPDALAKDVTQEAITRVFAYDSNWDPTKEPDLLRYLMSVVNSLLANERTSAAAKRTDSMSRKRPLAAAEAVGDPQAFSETKAVENDLLTRRMTLLTERLVGDAKATTMVELMVQGVDSPTEIRRLTGWTADEVMATRRRMLRAAALVARDLGSPSGDDALTSAAAADDDEDEVA